MPKLTTPDGIDIRYEAVGSGRPLVLAHGFGVSLDMWWPQSQALAAQHRFIAWDARGHGSSSAPNDAGSYSMPALAGDLRHLLEAIDAVEGAVIGGMSFGGQIALQYAVTYPEDTRALILSDSTTRGSTPPSGVIPPMVQGEPGLVGAYRAMDERPDLTPQLGTLTMPALVIYGEHDQYISTGVQRLIAGLPNRRVVQLRYASHGTSGQRPADWSAVVLRFIDDVDRGVFVGGEEIV